MPLQVNLNQLNRNSLQTGQTDLASLVFGQVYSLGGGWNPETEPFLADSVQIYKQGLALQSRLQTQCQQQASDNHALIKLDKCRREVHYAKTATTSAMAWQMAQPKPPLPIDLPKSITKFPHSSIQSNPVANSSQNDPLTDEKQQQQQNEMANQTVDGKENTDAHQNELPTKLQQPKPQDNHHQQRQQKPPLETSISPEARVATEGSSKEEEKEGVQCRVRFFIRQDASISVRLDLDSPGPTTIKDLNNLKIKKASPIIRAMQQRILPYLLPGQQGRVLSRAVVRMAASGAAAASLQPWQRLPLIMKESQDFVATIIKPQWGDKPKLVSTRNALVLQAHGAARKEWREARAKAQRARLAALKADNLEGYMSMVQGAKNSQIDHLLDQTDACLRQLTQRLAACGSGAAFLHQETAAGETSGGSSPSSNQSQEKEGSASKLSALKQSSVAWNSLAAAFDADITEQPGLLSGGELREYQMKGLRWMVGLHDNALNGILADEMGLGKTIQIISLVAYLVEARQEDRPFLIAAPSSVLPNWEKEFATWSPELRVVAYKGNPEQREKIFNHDLQGGRTSRLNNSSSNRAHVVLTSYEFLMGKTDRPRLSRIPWSYIIIDEGHRLKNSGCRLNSELKHYSTSHRLLLTGTPLQNSLDELWALLNFLMPQLFDSADDFEAWFGGAMKKRCAAAGVEDEDEDAEDAAMLSEEEMLIVTNCLHQVLRPFMLRRLKESVASELPQKIEHLIPCAPSPYQQQLFDLLQSQLGQPGGARGINNTMMELRSICNHPLMSRLHPEGGEHRLSPHPLPPEIRLCGKLEVLDRILLKLKAGGHKVLLFCTMTRLLDVLEGYLEWRGLRFLRLDGGTAAADRGALVQEFNDPDSDAFIFLLSVRAGGVGLNLQGADTVIFYDTDWNPQMDAQAQARAHRIGQNRSVLVLRLQTVGTVEERIIQVAATKRSMADRSITGGFFDGKTSASERQRYLLDLLKAGSEQSTAAAEAASKQLTDARMNELLARGDHEVSLFEAQDMKLAETEAAVWAKIQGKRPIRLSSITEQQPQQQQQQGGTRSGGLSFPTIYSRLATSEDIAELALEAISLATPKDSDEGKEFGRGKRIRGGGEEDGRSAVDYTGLSQREFNSLCKHGQTAGIANTNSRRGAVNVANKGNKPLSITETTSPSCSPETELVSSPSPVTAKAPSLRGLPPSAPSAGSCGIKRKELAVDQSQVTDNEKESKREYTLTKGSTAKRSRLLEQQQQQEEEEEEDPGTVDLTASASVLALADDRAAADRQEEVIVNSAAPNEVAIQEVEGLLVAVQTTITTITTDIDIVNNDCFAGVEQDQEEEESGAVVNIQVVEDCKILSLTNVLNHQAPPATQPSSQLEPVVPNNGAAVPPFPLPQLQGNTGIITPIQSTDERGRMCVSYPGTELLLAKAIPYTAGIYRALMFTAPIVEEAMGMFNEELSIEVVGGHPCCIRPFIKKRTNYKIYHLHAAAFVRINVLGRGDCVGIVRGSSIGDGDGQAGQQKLYLEVNSDRVKGAARNVNNANEDE